MDISKLIIENIANPHELERMYRKEPETFKMSISCALGKNLIPRFLPFGMRDCILRSQQIQKKLPCFKKISYPWAF
ncbi:hypothetical protein N752_25040 [Desulforamulus aquiferis]|nr:hypothetical protein [Desulforamulus aquiferis]RYD02597.1 hypothetical protein N752_25040 [Desulforamulus aquiferis]